jgi:hypothetical protein
MEYGITWPHHDGNELLDYVLVQIPDFSCLGWGWGFRHCAEVTQLCAPDLSLS